MKAAYVCADRGVPVYGMKGCSLHVQEIIRALAQQTIQVDLFTANPGGKPPIDLMDIPVYRIICKAVKDRAAREQADRMNNIHIIKLLSLQDNYDFVYERYSLWCYAGMEYARQAGIPGILEVNAPLIEEQADYRGLIDRNAACEVAQHCFEAATSIIAVSEGVADYLHTFPQARDKIHVVPNGVNPLRFTSPARRLFPAQHEITLGFIGTLKPWHGVDQLIDAFEVIHSLHSNTHLLIVGDGPEYTALRNRARAAGLNNAVTFTGAVAPDKAPYYLSKMDIGVAPYPLSEAFYFSPLKIYEYMAAGLPVVASRIGQIATLVEHEHTGLLYNPGDTLALITGLERLVDNCIWATTLGWNARESIIQNHTWDARMEQILDVSGISRTLRNQLIKGTG